MRNGKSNGSNTKYQRSETQYQRPKIKDHLSRFVHRDIKPSNYTVGKEQTEWIYLIDFGICREIMVRRIPLTDEGRGL